MAADVLADQGLSVTVVDAKPSVGRKFLMAGKSGLNLTKDAPLETFLNAYDRPSELASAIRDFGPDAVQAWAKDLGQEVFTGSSGRVFPKAMKASPLLRSWLLRLAEKGVVTRTKMRCIKHDNLSFHFENGEVLTPDVAVLALGGASWARLGSDGAWADWIGGPTAPFKPANMGLTVEWSEHMTRHFGAPVKPVMLKYGRQKLRGEFVISSKGLEGSGIYAVSSAVRDGAKLSLDLMPDWSIEKITAHLGRPQGKASLTSFLRKSLKLDPVRLALLQEFGRPLPKGSDLAALLKNLPVTHQGPRPMDEAISTAGGVAWDGLEGLMLKAAPGVFVAG